MKRVRIIPTCVGKRIRYGGLAACAADHPHVRGEKTGHPIVEVESHGSSPRAWGKAEKWRLEQARERIIPTCVGKRAAQAQSR